MGSFFFVGFWGAGTGKADVWVGLVTGLTATLALGVTAVLCHWWVEFRARFDHALPMVDLCGFGGAKTYKDF